MNPVEEARCRLDEAKTGIEIAPVGEILGLLVACLENLVTYAEALSKHVMSIQVTDPAGRQGTHSPAKGTGYLDARLPKP